MPRKMTEISAKLMLSLDHEWRNIDRRAGSAAAKLMRQGIVERGVLNGRVAYRLAPIPRESSNADS